MSFDDFVNSLSDEQKAQLLSALTPKEKIVEESLNIAAEIDIYTNHTIQVEELACEI